MKRNVVLIVVVLVLVGLVLLLQQKQTQQKQQQQVFKQAKENPGTPWVQKISKRYPYSTQTKKGIMPSQGDVNRAWVFGNIVSMDEQKVIVNVAPNSDLLIKIREQTIFVKYDKTKPGNLKSIILKPTDFKIGDRVFVEIVPDSKEQDAYADQIQKNE